jgi:hypothetical protein
MQGRKRQNSSTKFELKFELPQGKDTRPNYENQFEIWLRIAPILDFIN